MATDYEKFWHGVGDKRHSNQDPSRRVESVLRCPQCDEWYSMLAADSVQANPNALGHRANCWFLYAWAAGVDAEIFDPTGQTGGGDPGGPGPGPASLTWATTEALWNDTDILWSSTSL